MLCYNMRCYAMPCYAMLYHAMLCYAMLCYAMLCCGVVWCGVVKSLLGTHNPRPPISQVLISALAKLRPPSALLWTGRGWCIAFDLPPFCRKANKNGDSWGVDFFLLVSETKSHFQHWIYVLAVLIFSESKNMHSSVYTFDFLIVAREWICDVWTDIQWCCKQICNVWSSSKMQLSPCGCIKEFQAQWRWLRLMSLHCQMRILLLHCMIWTTASGNMPNWSTHASKCTLSIGDRLSAWTRTMSGMFFVLAMKVRAFRSWMKFCTEDLMIQLFDFSEW